MSAFYKALPPILPGFNSFLGGLFPKGKVVKHRVWSKGAEERREGGGGRKGGGGREFEGGREGGGGPLEGETAGGRENGLTFAP